MPKIFHTCLMIVTTVVGGNSNESEPTLDYVSSVRTACFPITVVLRMGKEDKGPLDLFLLSSALSVLGSQERADFHSFSVRESLLG